MNTDVQVSPNYKKKKKETNVGGLLGFKSEKSAVSKLARLFHLVGGSTNPRIFYSSNFTHSEPIGFRVF